jgi:hypothetical protein
MKVAFSITRRADTDGRPLQIYVEFGKPRIYGAALIDADENGEVDLDVLQKTINLLLDGVQKETK